MHQARARLLMHTDRLKQRHAGKQNRLEGISPLYSNHTQLCVRKPECSVCRPNLAATIVVNPCYGCSYYTLSAQSLYSIGETV